MTRRAVSIQDIARAAGVSHSTVSRALRNSPLISTDVRDQIQRIALEMGYTPNAIAQSLQMQRTNTLGLVVTTIADPFWADVVKGVEEVARSASMSVFLSASHNDPAKELEVIETFHRRRVDGIIVADARIGSSQTERLARMRVPTVLINSQTQDAGTWLHSVMIDDERGARLAFDHLAGLGHRAIGYLGVGSRPRSNGRRLAAYQAGMADAGADPESLVALPHPGAPDDDIAVGRALLGQLVERGATAVLCYNDMVAIGALMACRERGVDVPGDLSVVGVDDILMASYVLPPLTTVHQPKVQLGVLATDMVLDLLADRPVQDKLVAPTLVIRESTAPPRAGH